MRQPSPRFLSFGLILLIGIVTARSAQASQIRPLNIEEMTERAATIFSGRCVDVRVERDPTVGRDIVVATFDVERPEKGAAGRRVTVRMLASAALESSRGNGGDLGFRPGDEIVLFLYGTSSLGLTSPVGLGQGSFQVVTDKTGRKIALNRVGNKGLLSRLSPGAASRVRPSGPRDDASPMLTATELLDMVHTLKHSPKGGAR